MALFDGLAGRAERHAGSIVRRALDVAEVAVSEFPDIMLHREGDRLVLSGRGVMRRWLGDVRLRFALWRRG